MSRSTAILWILAAMAREAECRVVCPCVCVCLVAAGWGGLWVDGMYVGISLAIVVSCVLISGRLRSKMGCMCLRQCVLARAGATWEIRT